MVNVAAGVVLRPRADEQDADRGGDDGDAETLRAGQPAADAGRLRPLKQKSPAVVK